jgi:FtsZ-interacting cell division protein ZipA
MLVVYFGILAVGIIAIILILMNENKGSRSSAVDLLNSLDVDENATEEKKEQAPQKVLSSNFLNRLNLDDEKTKKTEASVTVAPDEKPIEVSSKEPIKNEIEPSKILNSQGPTSEKSAEETPKKPYEPI